MARRIRPMELAVLGALLLQYGRTLVWIGRTWRDATYESFGFLAALLLIPFLLRPSPPRPQPSRPHLVAVLGLAVVDLLAARLQLSILSAVLAVVSLHLGWVAFRLTSGAWYRQRQLWLGLLCLPAVFWANLVVGYPLQQLATRLAAGGLRLYGLAVTSRGTVLELPGITVTVDAACSGVKLLYSGLLFGLLAAPAAGLARRALFWGALLAGLLLTNAARVMCLALAELHLGRPLGDVAHQAVGLLCFLMVAATSLLLVGARPLRPAEVRP